MESEIEESKKNRNQEAKKPNEWGKEKQKEPRREKAAVVADDTGKWFPVSGKNQRKRKSEGMGERAGMEKDRKAQEGSFETHKSAKVMKPEATARELRGYELREKRKRRKNIVFRHVSKDKSIFLI